MSPAAERARWWYGPVGFAIGFVGSLCGIGGGLFAGPLLHFTAGLRLKQAAATALFLVFATTAAATVAELLHADSQVPLAVVAPLVVGVLLGAQLGFLVSSRIEERRLRQVFVVVLFLAGARVLVPSSPAPLAPGEVREFALWVPLVVGLGGGFLSPLLGVGGGLLMVPGLYLGLPGLGFSGARAASLAAGGVGALRSLYLHGRAGNLVPRHGVPLAVGALAGAVCGVVVLRQPGVVHVGRVLLGLILWAQSLRFARDLWRQAGGEPEGGAEARPPG